MYVTKYLFHLVDHAIRGLVLALVLLSAAFRLDVALAQPPNIVFCASGSSCSDTDVSPSTPLECFGRPALRTMIPL